MNEKKRTVFSNCPCRPKKFFFTEEKLQDHLIVCHIDEFNQPAFTLSQVEEIIAKELETKMFGEFGWNCVCSMSAVSCIPHKVLNAIRETTI